MRAILSVIFLFFVCSSNITAQTTFQIISSADQAPLPFATIINATTGTVHSADENGTEILNATKGDSIRVSYIGYKTVSVLYNGDGKQTISLAREITLMKEVTITSCKAFDELVENDLVNEHEDLTRFGGVQMDIEGTASKEKFAVHLPGPKESSTLTGFSFWLKRWHLLPIPKRAVRSPLLISFYEVADTGNLPGAIISDKPLIYFPKKEGRQDLDIDSLHIHVPPKGIYICFQWVIDPKYQWTMPFKNPGDSVITTKTYQGIPIDGIYAKDYDIAFYNILYDRWVSMPIHKAKSGDNYDLKGTIRLEAVLKYCKDE